MTVLVRGTRGRPVAPAVSATDELPVPCHASPNINIHLLIFNAVTKRVVGNDQNRTVAGNSWSPF